MTSPGQYGSHQYQSPETRALAGITAESYDKDQAKTLIKLKNDVGYMAAYMRKLQKEVDQANENFIQQIQSFIADFIVLLGGGSLTTIDFGDLRYVIQAIGALLGFQTVAGIPIPINLFTAAWNFFGIYIAPTAQFADVINELIDAAFAIIIDAFGEIPVFGQAIQQLAAWLIEIRDALWPLVDTVFLLIDTLSGQPGTETEDVMFGVFHQVMDMLIASPQVLLDVLDALIDLLLETPQILLALLNGLIQMLIDSPELLDTVLRALVDLILQIPEVLEQLLTGLIQLLIQVPNLLFELLDALMTLLTASPDVLARLITGIIELLVNLPAELLQLLESLVGLLIISPEILADLTVAVSENLGDLIGIDFSSFNAFLNSIADGFAELFNFNPANALSSDSPLNALNLFNQVPPNLLGLIPVSQIGDIATNLLENPNFATPQSLVNNPGWTWNGTDVHTTGGSAQTVANGQSHSIISNSIPVAQGQALVVGIWTKYVSINATPSADAIRLSVEGYLGNALQSVTMIDSIESPNGSSVNAGHNNFVQLTGNYPVPAGIDNIVVVPEVTAAASSGAVLFGDAQATKSGLMPQNLVANLPADIQARINELNNLTNAVAGKANALVTDVENRLKNIKFDTGLLDISKVFNKAPIAAIPADQLTVANVPDLGSVTDQLTNGLIGAGAQFLGTIPQQARLSMDRLYNDVMSLTQKMQDIRSGETAQNVSGTTYTINFSNYPDGNMPSDWTTTYRGTGTSTTGITSGKAGWRNRVNNGNRDALIVQNATPSKTDYQIIRGTLANAPAAGGSGGVPKMWSMGRVDNPANPRNYVWCRGRCNGFLSYVGDVGCTINGVDTVWFSNIPLTWSMDIAIIIGVGGNPRRYQVFSGTQLVKDWIEPGTASMIGPGYRYWGAINEIRTDSNGAIAAADVAGTSMSDNEPPAVIGSTFRAFRLSTASVTFNGWNQTPNNFFDSMSYKSDDFSWDGTNLTITTEGTYLVNIRYSVINLGGQERADCSVFKNHSPIRKMGGMWSYNSYEGNMFGLALVYCKAGEILTPGYSVTDNVTVNGEVNGTDTYFEATLVNRSLA